MSERRPLLVSSLGGGGLAAFRQAEGRPGGWTGGGLSALLARKAVLDIRIFESCKIEKRGLRRGCFPRALFLTFR